MDRTRKANREDDEKTLQYRTPNEVLREAELVEERVAHFQARIAQMEQTPEGQNELLQRAKLFGVCQRLADDTSAQFCDKLRVWLETDLPQTRLPLHPPRQGG